MKNEQLLNHIQSDLTQHTKDDKEFQLTVAGEVKDIKTDINIIKENHLAHIQVSLERTTTNLDWLMKFFWIIAGASIGSLVTSIINLTNQIPK